jgi:hypothetical protein
MLSFHIILHLQINGHTADFVCLPANRAEFPALVPVYIGERPAAGAPDNDVHGQRVISNLMIKIYRLP